MSSNVCVLSGTLRAVALAILTSSWACENVWQEAEVNVVGFLFSSCKQKPGRHTFGLPFFYRLGLCGYVSQVLPSTILKGSGWYFWAFRRRKTPMPGATRTTGHPLSRSASAPARVGLYPKPYGTCTTCTCISQCHVCSGHTVWVLYNIDAWFSCSMSMAGSTAWLYCSTSVIALGGSHAYPNFTALYCCAVLLLLCFVWDQPYMQCMHQLLVYRIRFCY